MPCKLPLLSCKVLPTVVTMLEQQSSLALILPGFETRHQGRQNVALLLSASPSSTAVAFEVYINPLSNPNTCSGFSM